MMTLQVTPACVHAIPLETECNECLRWYRSNARTPLRLEHEYQPWTMQCRGCGWTKSQIENWSKTTPAWDTCRGEGGPMPVKPDEPTTFHTKTIACAPATRRTRVYVSGPLTTGMLTANVRRAADAANELLEAGYAVYLPHTNVLWEMIAPPIDDYEKDYEKWLSHDFEWVGACDVTLRLPGPSHGADREVELAKSLGQPIYDEVALVKLFEPPTRPR